MDGAAFDDGNQGKPEDPPAWLTAKVLLSFRKKQRCCAPDGNDGACAALVPKGIFKCKKFKEHRSA